MSSGSNLQNHKVQSASNFTKRFNYVIHVDEPIHSRTITQKKIKEIVLFKTDHRDWFMFGGRADFNHSEVTSNTTHVI